MTRETLLKAFLEYVLPPLATALGAAAVWAIAKLATWLHSKEQGSKLAQLGAVVVDMSQSIVAELNVTLRPQLAAALADGVLTDVEKAQLKTTAVGILKTKLPVGLQALARQFFGDAVDTWLGGHVERALQSQTLMTGGFASIPKPAP